MSDPTADRTPAAHPCGSIAPIFWQAMRGAASSPDPRGAKGISDEEISEQLPLIWEAIWQAAGGHEPRLVPCPPAWHAQHLLSNVRRTFITLIRSVDGDLPVQEVVRVLDAIERVQSAIEGDASPEVGEQGVGGSRMDLLVQVAKDVLSPLASILFLAETLRAGQVTRLTPMEERQLRLIHSAAFEVTSMANDLIALTQGGEQLIEIEAAPFGVRNVLHSVRDTVRPIADEKGIDVRLAEPETTHRLGHPAALGRVLLNLATNAVRSTDEGFVEIIARDLSPTRLEFEVRDSGPGVPDEVIASLLQPFDPQALGVTRSFSSSKLGLAICRRLVTAMGGDLRVRSVPDRGSCFHFALDLPADPAAAEQISLAEHSGAGEVFDPESALRESTLNHG